MYVPITLNFLVARPNSAQVTWHVKTPDDDVYRRGSFFLCIETISQPTVAASGMMASC